MPVTVIIGAQWGDEGKGKQTDILAEDADVVVRYQGGSNAGHTVEANGHKYDTHALPSGIIRPGKLNLVGPYVLCDLEQIIKELETISIPHGSKVLLDRSAPIALPIHKDIDNWREKAAGSGKIGTTGRGLGPGYEDLASRRAPKLGDLTSPQRFRQSLMESGFYEERQAVLRHLGMSHPPSDLYTVIWAMNLAPRIVRLLADTREVVATKLAQGENVLFEGAQGVGLDVLQGSQPFTTSSICTAAAVSLSYGIYAFDRVIGVSKAYCTRVGAGPFPTIQDNLVGEELRRKGAEFGVTTGRPRDCGWLDLVHLRHCCRFGGVTELTLTKLDVLTGLGTIPVCTEYEFEGTRLGDLTTLTARVLRDSKPVYSVLPGWTTDISGCRTFDELPAAAQEYVRFVAERTGVPVTSVGVGPRREQLITLGG